MPFKRQGSPYWYAKWYPGDGGRAVRRSTGTRNKREAAAIEARWKEAARRTPSLTWERAVLRWLEDKQHKRSLHSDKGILRWLHPHLSGKLLSDIDRDMIERVRRTKRAEASASTVNRTMALVRAILNAAVKDWEVLDKAPHVPMYTLESGEPHYLTREQFDTLEAELPPHLADIARFAVSTGLRAAAIKGLQWKHVHAERLIVPASLSKNAKPIVVPLNRAAADVVERRRRASRTRERGGSKTWVFTYRGKRLRDKLGTRAWFKALKRAKLPYTRFHDLRHTWASWHVQNGTPLHVLQELGGWSSLEMVQRYAHLAPSDLAQWAENSETDA